MQISVLLLALLALTFLGYYLGRSRSVAMARSRGGIKSLHSLPSYYGFYTALWCGVPALILLGLWLAFQDTLVTQLVI
ncbi:MAG: phosphate ABC transporter permease family protein, partial [Candidatus Competibacteraceae bacterium]|nr:phosphate ABC transporter permease family protein [Candidatus Competibacteraceae bacterium]